MRGVLFFALLMLLAALPISAQFTVETVSVNFTVELKLGATDAELEKRFSDALLTELGELKDVVVLAEKARFGLIVEIIRRPVGNGENDIFVSAISTSSALCIVGMDHRGKVVSRQPCKEFLTANSYAGRDRELPSIAKEIIAGFNGYALEPLRGLKD